MIMIICLGGIGVVVADQGDVGRKHGRAFGVLGV